MPYTVKTSYDPIKESIFCPACSAKCARKKFRPLLGAKKDVIYHYLCPNGDASWHEKVALLYNEMMQIHSPTLKAIIKSDIEILLATAGFFGDKNDY